MIPSYVGKVHVQKKRARPGDRVRAVWRVAIALALCGGSIAFAEPTPVSPSPPTVLLVHSYRSTTMVGLEDAFRDRLETSYGGPVDLQVEFLDLPDASIASHSRRLFDLLSEKYATQRVHLVTVVGLEGLRFVLEKRAGLFPAVPVVFTNIDRDSVLKLGPLENATGAYLKIRDQGTMRAALDLQPEARRVVLVCGSSPGDKENEAFARRMVEARSPGMETISLAGLALPEQLDRLSRLSRDSVVFFVSYRADSEGRSTVARDVLRQVTKASRAPVYGAGGGWLGLRHRGRGPDRQRGRSASARRDLASRILRGEAASSIPPSEEPRSGLMFDWRQLRRWGLDEARLPAGSLVLFREKTLWSEYRRTILGVLCPPPRRRPC